MSLVGPPLPTCAMHKVVSRYCGRAGRATCAAVSDPMQTRANPPDRFGWKNGVSWPLTNTRWFDIVHGGPSSGGGCQVSI
jgi:hypothetical protein